MLDEMALSDYADNETVHKKAAGSDVTATEPPEQRRPQSGDATLRNARERILEW